MELTERGFSFFSLFESITSVMPKDFSELDEMIVFIVDRDNMGKAIGKKGANIAKLKAKFKKKVFVVSDADTPENFIRNFFNNINVLNIEERTVMGEKSFLIYVEEQARGLAVGHNGERIKILKDFLKKKFNATAHIRTKRILAVDKNEENKNTEDKNNTEDQDDAEVAESG